MSEHWSSPNGCHEDCPACAEEREAETGIKITDTRKVACISTAHMTADDAKLLQSGVQPSGLYYSNDYLWAFTEMDGGYAQEWRERGFSDAMIDAVTKVSALGFDRVEFDQDGERVEGLETFDW